MAHIWRPWAMKTQLSTVMVGARKLRAWCRSKVLDHEGIQR
jgi:hypothetical protein